MRRIPYPVTLGVGVLIGTVVGMVDQAAEAQTYGNNPNRGTPIVVTRVPTPDPCQVTPGPTATPRPGR